MRNKYPGGCAGCSVQVLQGGGFMVKTAEGLELRCATCWQVDMLVETGDLDHDQDVRLPAAVPMGSATTVALRVLGMTRTCGNCAKDTVCVVGLYPAFPARWYGGLHGTDGQTAMELAIRLLESAGRRDLAIGVERRYSRSTRRRDLANICRDCETLQRNGLVHAEAYERIVAAGGADGLDTLIIADCPLLEWQAVIHSRDGSTTCV